jgi:hypothetical protein
VGAGTAARIGRPGSGETGAMFYPRFEREAKSLQPRKSESPQFVQFWSGVFAFKMWIRSEETAGEVGSFPLNVSTVAAYSRNTSIIFIFIYSKGVSGFSRFFFHISNANSWVIFSSFSSAFANTHMSGPF